MDVRTGRVISWTPIKGVQPLVLAGEYDEVAKIVKADARWQAAMRRRDITDFEKVQVDTWAVGQVPAALQGNRLFRALSYFKGDQLNFYGRPIEGVVAIVNMNTEQVVEVVDTGVVPLPPPSQEFDEKSTGVRAAPKPLLITQPGRHQLHHQRAGDPLAEMALPLLDAPARRARAAHRRLRG